MSYIQNVADETKTVVNFGLDHKLYFGVIIAMVVLVLFLVGFLSKKSGFASPLWYSGPGGALNNLLGSCRSDREAGPYNSCGAAEAFQSLFDKNAKSGFVADNNNLRYMTSRSSGFLGSREQDSVIPLDQEGTDLMQSEIHNLALTGAQSADTGADAIMAAHSHVGQAAASAVQQTVAAVSNGQITAAQAPNMASQLAAAGGAAASQAAVAAVAAVANGSVSAANAPALASNFAARPSYTGAEDHLVSIAHGL